MSTRELPNDVARTALRVLKSLGGPMADEVHSCIKQRQWDKVSEISPDPRSYKCPRSYFRDAAAAGLLRKFAQLPTSHDRAGNALKKWYEGERDCFLANERLSPFLRENSLFSDLEDLDPEGRLRKFIADVRKKIVSWIGHVPRAGMLEGRFGPGATFSLKGGWTTVPDKINAKPSLTRGARGWLLHWLVTSWGSDSLQRHGEVDFVPGNRFATVPKNAKTDRSIAAEPDLNVFYQLAVGRELKRLLRTNAGWDMKVAQDIHKRVACESSVTREFATLDLSNASDTVARNLVKLLLPHEWFLLLDGLRSPKTRFGKHKWVVLEKFSSMGNGFTFELETLIFAAISSTLSEQLGFGGDLGKDVYVYGDDIIVRDGVVKALIPALSFFGFTLNHEKSFWGPDVEFRESCGGDFFNGKSVRPYHLEEDPNEPAHYIAFANGLRALGDRLAACGLDDLRGAWFSVLDCLPSDIRSCRGPEGLGDLVIWDDRERWTVKVRNSVRYLRVYRPARKRKVNVHAFRNGVILACAAYGTPSPHPKGWAWHRSGGVIPRDGVLSYKVGWTPYS